MQIQKKWLGMTMMRKDQDGFRETLKEQVGAHISKISIERAFENGHIVGFIMIPNDMSLTSPVRNFAHWLCNVSIIMKIFRKRLYP